ncbi:MAG TPA: YggT family protein [Candidatus Obscuribacterales bacterium]
MTPVQTLIFALHRLIWVLLLARCVVSFIPNLDSRNPIVAFIFTVTDPILAPFKAILPTTRIGIDFSPILALFVLDIVFRLLFSITG